MPHIWVVEMDAKGFKRSPRGGSNIEVETVYDSDKWMNKCIWISSVFDMGC